MRLEEMTAEYEEALHILKNEFQANPESAVVECRAFDIPSSVRARERFIFAYQRHLAHIIGADLSDRVSIVLNETLMNVEEHAHKYDAKKKARVYSIVFDDHVYLSVQSQGPGFDVESVRRSAFNSDGTLYNLPRGRGYIMILGFSDKVITRDKGRELYALIKTERPTPKSLM
jgi:anti-sigma regulatory factor (Ser/Thr protein kinase)